MAEGAGLYLDYSKHRITDETVQLLLQLADESGLRERIDAMFRVITSTCRRTERCSTSRFGCPGTRRWWSTESMWSGRCTRCWIA